MCKVLLLLVTFASATIDIPVIIDREFSRQFETDFLTDYDGERPPNNSIQVNVVFDIKYLKWMPDSALLVAELIQSWEDTRLLFPPQLSIFVPDEKKLWSPDSYFENAIDIHWDNKRSRRLNRGFVYQKERVKLLLPCSNGYSAFNDTDCCQRVSIVFGSFDNAAVKFIKYSVTKVIFSCNTSTTVSNTLSYCIKDQDTISPNGQKLYHLEVDVTRNNATAALNCQKYY
uniref:Neur_chan_LBD domain-containing protein n=1 Tax=Syphacia muris TaxID=451379 RepID=A0A0N5B0S3_9BILA